MPNSLRFLTNNTTNYVVHNFGQNPILPKLLEMSMTSVTGDPTKP